MVFLWYLSPRMFDMWANVSTLLMVSITPPMIGIAPMTLSKMDTPVLAGWYLASISASGTPRGALRPIFSSAVRAQMLFSEELTSARTNSSAKFPPSVYAASIASLEASRPALMARIIGFFVEATLVPPIRIAGFGLDTGSYGSSKHPLASRYHMTSSTLSPLVEKSGM